MKVHNLTIDSTQRDSATYPHANNYVISLENPIYDVEEICIVSGRIPTPQTPSPNSLVVRLSSGSDDFNQSVYSGTPHYTGHILLNGDTSINFNGSDDPIIHRFHSGSQKYIKELGVEFLYLSNGELERYDFGGSEHVLKFEIKCSTDKLENLTKVSETVEELLAPVHIPEKEENVYRWRKEYTYIILIVLVGLLLMKPISELRRRRVAPASGPAR